MEEGDAETPSGAQGERAGRARRAGGRLGLTSLLSFHSHSSPNLRPLPASPLTRSGLAYKTALLASSNGVHGLLTVRAPLDAETGRCAVYVGGGDGSLRCFIGAGLDWVCTAEARLQGRVTGMSICAGAGC